MENKTLICKLDLFTLHQSIMLANENSQEKIETTPLNNVGRALAFLCDKENVEHIHLFGNTEYIDKIIQDFDVSSNLKFSNKIVTIEVN